MKKIFKDNSLSIVFFSFFILSLIGQAITGIKVYNEEMAQEGGKQVDMFQYLSTGHFIEATFENWESEFLQMALYVLLSMFLFQRGSSESKDPDGEEEVDREPDPRRKDAPWPVRKGGLVLSLYKHSLCSALFLLFILCFCVHWYGSLKQYNEMQSLKGQPLESGLQYLGNPQLWVESFENWQSEFLSVFTIVVLSIFLRQKGSAQSKPVDAPNSETGG